MTDQTPPTDRPLTAGDVPLLREGDVLRVVEAGSFLLGRGLVDGGPAIVRSVDPPYVDVYGPKERSHNRPSRFTFVSRPATSAASEGEGVVSKSDAIRAVDACGGTYSPDEERSGYADGHREALTAALSALAALASPPVSERERELEGALRVIADASRRSETMFGGKMSDVTRVFQNITRVAETALTAQPAGEGK